MVPIIPQLLQQLNDSLYWVGKNLSNESFKEIMNQELYFTDYHIFENPNVSSIQHIDCMAKLVNPETIIIKEVSESSPEYDCIEEFAQSFYELNTFYDREFNVHRIYCPEINAGPWETNPVAAYTNSLILNGKVLVPQYGIPEDVQALETYQNTMPGYEVIGFNHAIGDPWYSEDALHCRTMGIFDPDMLHMSHKAIRNNQLLTNSNINIEVEIIDYSSNNLESVILFWKYSAEDGPFAQVDLIAESDTWYIGSFPDLNSNSEIEYFIRAMNSDGNTVSHPNAGWHIFNTLDFRTRYGSRISYNINPGNDARVVTSLKNSGALVHSPKIKLTASIEDALEMSISSTGAPVVAAGSFYLVGLVTKLLGINTDSTN